MMSSYLIIADVPNKVTREYMVGTPHIAYMSAVNKLKFKCKHKEICV